MKKLRQKYKSEKDKRRISGRNRSKEWKFFQKMDAFLSKKHNIEPPVIIDTMAESVNSETSAPQGEYKEDKQSLETSHRRFTGTECIFSHK